MFLSGDIPLATFTKCHVVVERFKQIRSVKKIGYIAKPGKSFHLANPVQP